MIKRKMVNISAIEFCVLDEADEMLNMGFYDDIKDILKNTPNNKGFLALFCNDATRS
jgi:ATP-dependent RNA helicase DeaD